MKSHAVTLYDMVFLLQDTGFPLHPRDTLEISKQAALNPKLGRSSLRDGNIEMPSWIVGADLILYVQNILPLQELCQAHIKPEGVGSDVDPGVCAQLAVREFGDHGIGVLHRVKVKESNVSRFPDLAGVERHHPGIAQEACAKVSAGLHVHEHGEFLAVKPHTFLGDAVSQMTNLKAGWR